MGEPWPILRTGDDLSQFGEHLAAVANPEAEAILPREEGLELIAQHGIEGDAARPTDACAQRIAIAEAAAGD